jgi:hypothetical protein
MLKHIVGISVPNYFNSREGAPTHLDFMVFGENPQASRVTLGGAGARLTAAEMRHMATILNSTASEMEREAREAEETKAAEISRSAPFAPGTIVNAPANWPPQTDETERARIQSAALGAKRAPTKPPYNS